MTKINGVRFLEHLQCELGYIRFSGALVSAACDFFFQRLKRPAGPRIVRVKRSKLSSAKRTSSLS